MPQTNEKFVAKTAQEVTMPRFIKVLETDDLLDGSVRAVEADGTCLALCKYNGQLFAISDFCPHLSGHLAQGRLESDELICPEHGWRFKLTTGRCTTVRDRSAHTFPVRVDETGVYVGV